MLDPEKYLYAVSWPGRENIRNFIIINLRKCGSKSPFFWGMTLDNLFVTMQYNVVANPSLRFNMSKTFTFDSYNFSQETIGYSNKQENLFI
jgi:hypothetical protein